MSFPMAMGLSPLGGPHQEPEDFLRLLLRLQGEGGYTEDEGSLNVRELRAVAVVASAVACAIERAGEQAFVTEVTELLAEWERALNLPNDAARTVEESRDRLKLILSSVGGVSEDRVKAILSAAGVSADVLGYDYVNAQKLGMVPEVTRQSAVDIGSAIDTPRLRKMVEALLLRILPASAIGQNGGGVRTSDMLISQDTAVWASANRTMGRCAISQAGSPNARWPARVQNYGKRSRIHAAPLNEWQDGVLWSPGEGLPNMTEVGGEWVYIEKLEPAAGGASIVDTSFNWRDRFLRITGRVSTSDIRPGQASEDQHNAATRISSVGYTGLGGSASGYEIPLATDLILFADPSTSVLYVYNTSASDKYVNLLIRATPQIGER